MSVIFRAQINWLKGSNEIPLPANKYPGLQVPTGLSLSHVRTPTFIDATRLTQESRTSGVATGTTYGLVTPDLEVRFANFASQWRHLPSTEPQAAHRFQFAGGEIFLDLTLGIYILDTAKPAGDPVSAKIFTTAYSHELLHVRDEIDIVTNWLPPRLKDASVILRHLMLAEPLDYGSPAQPIPQVEQEFRRYIQERILNEIREPWAKESTQRSSSRDELPRYKVVQDRIAELRRQQFYQK